jgi:hypothetical protein
VWSIGHSKYYRFLNFLYGLPQVSTEPRGLVDTPPPNIDAGFLAFVLLSFIGMICFFFHSRAAPIAPFNFARFSFPFSLRCSDFTKSLASSGDTPYCFTILSQSLYPAALLRLGASPPFFQLFEISIYREK